MINITIFSKTNISIENQEYNIESMEDMVNFLTALIDKTQFSGERFCLETATIVENKVFFKTIKRW